MKKSISYNAVSNSGTTQLTTYYWNGSEYTTEVVEFDESVINEELVKATAGLENEGFVAFAPEKYNFGIR